VNKTLLITEAASTAVRLCVEHYLQMPGRAEELIGWYQGATRVSEEPSYADYDHLVYRSFNVWMPVGIDVVLSRVFRVHGDQLIIHGDFWIHFYYEELYFDFRRTSSGFDTRFHSHVDQFGRVHDVIKLRSSCVRKVVSGISASYEHLGLDT